MKVGVLGAGQLGRMLALDGYPLGLRFRFFDPTHGSPANDLADQHAEDYADSAALKKFAQGLHCITYEFENVPVESARILEREVANVFPPVKALEITQDRVFEKTFFRSLGIETAPFRAVDSLEELRAATEELGLPAVLKTRRFGYDGKGQAVLHSVEEAEAAFERLGGKNLILEGFVKFERELSVIAARNASGETVFYPLVENIHREGILHISRGPAPLLLPLLQTQGEAIAAKVMGALDYRGVIAIEFFEKQGQLIANEMACRVHNSGHWTIEGAEFSQFENHLRAGLDFPLGCTRALGFAAMLNLVGSVGDTRKILAVEGAHLHLYNKAPKPGRKLGHVTLVADDVDEREERLAELLEAVRQS